MPLSKGENHQNTKSDDNGAVVHPGAPAHFMSALSLLDLPKFFLRHAFMSEFANEQAQDDVYDFFI